MATFATRSVSSLAMEIENAYQDLSALLARLVCNPGDIAAIQKLSAKQTQIEQLEAAQRALAQIDTLTRPARKSYVA